MATQTKSSRSDRNRKMIAGVEKHSGPTIVVDGTSYAPADIAKALQASIDAADATATAEAAFHQAVVAEKSANAKGDGVYKAMKTVLITQYTSQPAALGDYGIALVTKQVPDASKVAAAVVKRAATRAARSTMGTRQKAAVKGDVTGITITPTTPPHPVAPVAAAAPAPAAVECEAESGPPGPAPESSAGAGAGRGRGKTQRSRRTQSRRRG